MVTFIKGTSRIKNRQNNVSGHCSVTSIGQLMHLTIFLFFLPIEESILAPINGDTRLSCELRGNAASDLRIKWVRPDGRPLSENSYESRGELLIQNVQL